jgi:hypothetical protein
MNCLSAASFRLFYCRVSKRLETWTAAFVQRVIALGGKVPEANTGQASREGLEAQWGWFIWLSTEYVRLYARLPGVPVIAQRFLLTYIYAVLSLQHMGLGP